MAYAETIDEAQLLRALQTSALTTTQRRADSAAQRAAAQVRPYLPKPELQLRREQSLSEPTRFSTTVLGLALELELSGAHGRRRQAATLDRQTLRLSAHGLRWRRRCDLRRTIHRCYSLQRQHRLATAQGKRLDALHREVVRLVASGQRAPFDGRRVALLVARETLRRGRLAAQLRGALATLSSRSKMKITALRVAAIEARRGASSTPLVAAMQAAARAEAQRAEAARRGWIPALQLFAAYRADTSMGSRVGHGYELGLNLALPLSSPQRRDELSARARGRGWLAAAAHESARRRALRARLEAEHHAWRRLRPASSTAAKSLLDAARRRLKVGEGNLSEVLEALATQRDIERAQLRRELELRRMKLELSCLHGPHLSGAERQTNKPNPASAGEPTP